MIADLINSDYSVRLITRNVMAVLSSDSGYTDHFAYNIKHETRYIINNDTETDSENVVAFITRDYNSRENIFRYVTKRFDVDKFSEYLNFFNKNHLLWLHFSDLSSSDRLLVEILIALLHNKKIIFLDYFDDAPFANDMISLLFKIGLDDRLIIYPCKDISFGINNSTCQCYVKNRAQAKIQSRFSEDYLEKELNLSSIRYDSSRPLVYHKHMYDIVPSSYKYSIYELVLIFIFNIRLLCIKAFNWSVRI